MPDLKDRNFKLKHFEKKKQTFIGSNFFSSNVKCHFFIFHRVIYFTVASHAVPWISETDMLLMKLSLSTNRGQVNGND